MKRALLVIDVQKEYFPGGALPIRHPENHLQNILETMDAAKANDVFISEVISKDEFIARSAG